ncbi:MAG: BLUF domain-containing protein [Rhodoferax sp.]|nr:BLUF domain-containing protein [Rhodoferax sp.]
MELIQLIYLSDLVDRDESQLGAILDSAQRHNSRDDITGMLLYAEGNFLQVLEGAPERVHATFERIRRDRRHRNIVTLLDEAVPQRHFANWSMGYKQLRPEHVQKFPRYAPYFQFGFASQKFQAAPGAALEMLEMFSKGAG